LAISNDKTEKVQNINDVQDDPDDRKHSRSGEQQDPHNLRERFVNNQQQIFDMASAEIRKGMKQSCWLWCVLPTAPYFRNGVEQGSFMNRHYALRGDDSVKSYLEFETDGVNLRRNDMQMLTAITTSQLKFGNPLKGLLGSSVAPKAISSFQLFEPIATELNCTRQPSSTGNCMITCLLRFVIGYECMLVHGDSGPLEPALALESAVCALNIAWGMFGSWKTKRADRRWRDQWLLSLTCACPTALLFAYGMRSRGLYF
jgi:uncharacterized protein (DUF1810 family)